LFCQLRTHYGKFYLPNIDTAIPPVHQQISALPALRLPCMPPHGGICHYTFSPKPAPCLSTLVSGGSAPTTMFYIFLCIHRTGKKTRAAPSQTAYSLSDG